jgi:hypothetical protein
MADLPDDRVNAGAPPFTYAGVDYLGPFIVHERRSLVKNVGLFLPAIRAIH